MRCENIGKQISPIDVLALAVGCAVGWGAFVMPSTVFLKQSGLPGAVAGFLIGTVLMLIVGKNYHYMLCKHPDNGGTVTYTKALFGGDHGFLCAWFLSLAYFSIIWANSTATALLTRTMFGNVLQVGFHYDIAGYSVYFGELILCIAVLLLAGLVSLAGKRVSAVVQTVFASMLFLGIITIFVLAMLHPDSAKNISACAAESTISGMQLYFTLLHIPWAFVGFEAISHFAEEFSFPVKKTFRIITPAVIMIALCYLLLTFVPAGGTLCFEGIIPTILDMYGSQNKLVSLLLVVTVFSGIFTGILGVTSALSRLLYSISRKDEKFKVFSKVGKNGAPVNAIIFIIAVSAIIPFFGRTALGWCVDVCTIGGTVAYAYTSAAAYKTAEKEGDKAARRTGAFGVVISIVMSVFLLFPKTSAGGTLETESYLILAFWCIIGFILFLYLFKHDKNNRFGDSLVVWIAMLTLIFFSSIMWMFETTKAAVQTSSEEIGEYYIMEFEKQGIVQDTAYEFEEKAHLHAQMERINGSLLLGIGVQAGLMMLSVTILLTVYSIMRSRENKIQIEKAVAQQQSKAKSFFLSNMSHDLRTPMNAVIGFTDLALSEDASAEQLREYLEKIKGSSHHLLELIDDILEMSRIESGKIDLEEAPTDLVEIMDSICDVFTNQTKQRNMKFTVDTSGVTDRYVICDRKRLNRVIMNLTGNACKFTPDGGIVSVKLMQERSENGTGSYRLHVKDNGIGMSEEFVKNVFTAFERERKASGIQGTGLGLAITKSIVDLMKGTINIETKSGVGTEFIVSLSFPITEEFKKEKKAEFDPKKCNFEGKRVLLAEDVPINREIAKRLLARSGFAVETAENGQIAVDMLTASEAGYYDVILMDIQMPVMDGHQAAKIIRGLENKKLAGIPIIAMTANAFAEDVEDDLAAGMNGHISKPIDADSVLRTLAEIIGS